MEPVGEGTVKSCRLRSSLLRPHAILVGVVLAQQLAVLRRDLLVGSGAGHSTLLARRFWTVRRLRLGWRLLRHGAHRLSRGKSIDQLRVKTRLPPSKASMVASRWNFVAVQVTRVSVSVRMRHSLRSRPMPNFVQVVALAGSSSVT